MEFNTNNKIKYMGKTVSLFLLVLLLMILVLVYGINRVKVLNEKISESQKIQKQLNKKTEILKDVQIDVEKNVGSVDIALPSKGVSLFGLNQIKNKALQFNLLLDNLKISVPTVVSGGIEKSYISFDLYGNSDNIYFFLDSLEKILPITKIEKLVIHNLDGNSNITVNLNIYGSELLKKIPSITGQISDLSNHELDVLDDLSEYEMPEFDIPKSSEFSERGDLFN